MVTLLGFFFIVANVIFVELFMPDLVGPVRTSIMPPTSSELSPSMIIGSYLALLQLCFRCLDVLDS